MRRGYSPDAGMSPRPCSNKTFSKLFLSDPVMAEYITIMIINNKTAGEYCVTCVAKPTLDAKAV